MHSLDIIGRSAGRLATAVAVHPNAASTTETLASDCSLESGSFLMALRPGRRGSRAWPISSPVAELAGSARAAGFCIAPGGTLQGRAAGEAVWLCRSGRQYILPSRAEDCTVGQSQQNNLLGSAFLPVLSLAQHMRPARNTPFARSLLSNTHLKPVNMYCISPSVWTSSHSRPAPPSRASVRPTLPP